MKKKTRLLLIIISALFIYLIIFPLPSPELAVRSYVFVSNPIKAITSKVHEGKIKNDPMYGDLYIINEIEKSFIYVKKNSIGWYVTTSGTGP
ncbi:hypothetical protein [Paenibacillus solani]|uniref:hypothetical protein n=1 Tax=Paenibacillus solani TaxID=1705565 RepID=UPI003D2A9CBA